MFKQLFLVAMILVVGLSVTTHQAHAADLSTTLARIDAIITEMQALRAEFAVLATSAEVTAPTSAVLGSVFGGVLGDDLAFGSTNDDIKRIQTLLATDSTIYPYGVASGFYGPKTQEAVRMFQSRFGLDTVGVVGPSTRALLEVFFAAYPTGAYPSDVLKKEKLVTQPVVTAQNTVSAASAPVVTTHVLKSISITEDDDEYIVRSSRADGTRNRDMILYPEDGDELVSMIAQKLGSSESEVRSLVDENDLDFDSSKSSRSSRADEGDAQDALDDANDAIGDAKDEINNAEDDGVDVSDADDLYDEARDLYKEARTALGDEEYDDAVDLAEEAQTLAEEAIDELGNSSSSGDIDTVEVEVQKGEADVVVEYDNGDDEKFTVKEDQIDDIIKEIADELDISENDVEDVVEFDYGDIDEIRKLVGDEFRVRVYFDSGVKVTFTFDNEADDSDVIEEIAKTLNLREGDVSRKY